MNGITLKGEPVVVVMSILAAAQVLFAGAGLSDIIGTQAVAFGLLVIGTIEAGIQFWVRNHVAALPNVAALVVDGTIVSGPADTQNPTGASVVVGPVT